MTKADITLFDLQSRMVSCGQLLSSMKMSNSTYIKIHKSPTYKLSMVRHIYIIPFKSTQTCSKLMPHYDKNKMSQIKINNFSNAYGNSAFKKNRVKLSLCKINKNQFDIQMFRIVITFIDLYF